MSLGFYQETVFHIPTLKASYFNYNLRGSYGTESLYTNHAAGDCVIRCFCLLVVCEWQDYPNMLLHFTIKANCKAPDNNLKAFSKHKAHLAKDFHGVSQSFGNSQSNNQPSPRNFFFSRCYNRSQRRKWVRALFLHKHQCRVTNLTL